jgi:hypothetical protein
MVTSSFALFFFQIEVEDVWTVRQRATTFREKIASSSPMACIDEDAEMKRFEKSTYEACLTHDVAPSSIM